MNQESSTEQNIDRWKDNAMDFTYLSEEKTVRASFFWNLYQSQADSFYAFYADNMKRLARILHKVEKNNNKTKQVKNSLSSSIMQLQEVPANADDQPMDDAFPSLTLLARLKDEVLELQDFVQSTESEFIVLLQTYDETHGLSVADSELAELRDTHTFLDLKELHSLVSRINECISKMRVGGLVAASERDEGVIRRRISAVMAGNQKEKTNFMDRVFRRQRKKKSRDAARTCSVASLSARELEDLQIG